MKVKIGAAVLLTSMMLGACGADDDSATEPSDQVTSIDTLEDQAADHEDPAEAVVSEEQLAPVSEEELAQATQMESLDDFEEFNEQAFFDVENLEANLITDDETERLVVFTEGDEQVFKSMYVKEDNHLTIIDLREQEVIQNAPI